MLLVCFLLFQSWKIPWYFHVFHLCNTYFTVMCFLNHSYYNWTGKTARKYHYTATLYLYTVICSVNDEICRCPDQVKQHDLMPLEWLFTTHRAALRWRGPVWTPCAWQGKGGVLRFGHGYVNTCVVIMPKTLHCWHTALSAHHHNSELFIPPSLSW